MRLKADIWVKAYLRQCEIAGASAMLVHRGDSDAGAIYIKVADLAGRAWLFGPAPAGFEEADVSLRWVPHFDGDPRVESEIDATLAQFRSFDPDLWIVEVEDRMGRHFLSDWLK